MKKLIIIRKGENLKEKLFRVSKGTLLVFEPSPGHFLSSTTSLVTNYPKKGSKFERATFNKIDLFVGQEDFIGSSLSWSASLKLELPGTFEFRCYHVDSLERLEWEAYVLVEPDFKIPIRSIKCQTVISKCLGPISRWRSTLGVSKEANYNLLHFTPIQQLGESNSSYSLSDQHKVNAIFEANFDDIKREVEYMEKKWNVLSITDIVLNHTSPDSRWLLEHPECSYNTINTPQLRPAFLIDCAFYWCMQDLMNTYIENDTLGKLSILLRTFYIPQLRLHELYSIDIENAVKNFHSTSRGQQLKVDYGLYRRNGAIVTCIPENIKTPEELIDLLSRENHSQKIIVKEHANYAVANIVSSIRYERLNEAGPYYRQPISVSKPLFATYFNHSPLDKFRLVDEEKLMYSGEKIFMANNGWVMGSAPSGGELDPRVYLRRELIAWGDCTKLRYGAGPQDCPYLWEHMRKYVEAQAKIFHGFRIDNCHSTPLHVAEHLIDVARHVRPDIYIMAELFTSSEVADNIYVNKLGLNSLIRESMKADTCRELGRLMYRYGGIPVGAFLHQDIELLQPGIADAILFDQTHDNPAMIEVRCVHDAAAVMALISMANCAIGSVRGYDELVPHQVDVVKENRLYQENLDMQSALYPLRRFCNGTLQRELEGCSEIFVDQVTDDIIAITRHNPIDGKSIIMVTRTVYAKEPRPCDHIRPLEIQGIITRILVESQTFGEPKSYEKNTHFINGLSEFGVNINQDCKLDQCTIAKFTSFGDRTKVEFDKTHFKPSSILAIEVNLNETQSKALSTLNEWNMSSTLLSSIDLVDANFILFRCAEEDGSQPYDLPGYTKFTYCGLYGLMYHLNKVRENHDQAHPLCSNLRDGRWLSDYFVARLRGRPSTQQLADSLDGILEQVYKLPRGMVPKYFDLIMSRLYTALTKLIYSRMSAFISKGPEYIKLMALSSVALVGGCASAPLPSVDDEVNLSSIAAGLPHFSTGIFRNWGRDTFIALRGLLLVTGRFVEAKGIILSFAQTLKRGLIPNLIKSGVDARYNCRDAVWWWLYCIREYTKMAPNGIEILRCKVRRTSQPKKRSFVLAELIQEALECHFRGVEFVEDGAGPELDEHMTDEGFTISFGVKQDTGFIFGGNRWNCGTWMDKMGSSVEAGTKGKPASPRDGSAIELVALSKAVISWLDDMHRLGVYPYDRVKRVYDNTITLEWTWKKWASLIQSNFEKYFYIPQQDACDPNPDLINRRGIYKDSVGASLKWQDYQFRPNFLIACVIAPELFDKNHAIHAIQLAKDVLCGPIGMKTLDPSDWNFHGDYDNSDTSSDPKVSRGFNYHQGPEWVWLMGYYIRASSKFLGPSERSHHSMIFSNLYSVLVSSPWLGLPELTNSDGRYCKDSCHHQAWSLGTVLEALSESTRRI